MSAKEKIKAQADKYVKRGKFQEAILEYKKLLSGDEQDIQIRNIIGDLYIKTKQTDGAVKEFLEIAKIYEKKGLYSKSIAILKRIKRVAPSDIGSIKKLAQLYMDQGFTSEAKQEYTNLAQALEKSNKVKDAIKMYEKLVRLSPNDMVTRIKLADMYSKEGMVEQAVGEFNTVAEYKIQNKELKDAKKILTQAKELVADNSRTLTNLIGLLKQENKKKEALGLVHAILKKDKENIKAMYILGNLHFEDGNIDEAEKIYLNIVDLRPKEIGARVKLGRISIQRDNLDEAFEIYDPLVDTLTQREKDNQAIGLLGLILATKKVHLATLEKLASLYKGKSQKSNLEIVDQVIFEEYKKNNLREKMLTILEEMVNFFPDNQEYYHEYRKLREELGITEEELEKEPAAFPLDETKETIGKALTKAQLYIEQGLVRNAKRILENLDNRYPDDPRIKEKLEAVKAIPQAEGEDILDRIERVRQQESQLLDKIPETEAESKIPVYREETREPEEAAEEKVTAADIFAETDIIPDISVAEGERRYFDLTDRVNDELGAIEAIINHQLQGETTVVEKPLTDIVSDFRSLLEKKVDRDDYESHYNLGIAFLEQGLFDEAIEECKIAAKSKKFEVDCYSIIVFCHRQKKEFKQALKWLNKTLEFAGEGSHEYFALKYELASLYEDMQDEKKALEAFEEVKKWNTKYRDVAKKIKGLEKRDNTAKKR